MKKYKDIDGNSGVDAYETEADAITVRFKDGAVYIYNNTSAGAQNIEIMKELAENGNGLNAFINTKVKKRYVRKII